MRIAIVTPTNKLTGGVEIFNRDISKMLVEKGHEVDIISKELLPEIPKGNLEPVVGDHFNQINKEKPYDVVLCNGEFGYAVEHPCAVNVFHGNYYGYARSVQDLVSSEVTQERLAKAEMQKVSAEGKYVVTVSNSSRSQLEEFGIKVDGVINNSVDTSIFSPQNLGIEDYALAISRGRYYEKGFDVISRLAEKGITIRVFGDQQINSSNIQNMGRVNNEVLAKEYNQARILLFPSRFEGGSLTTLEAMACGCPLITTPTGYGPEIQKVIPNFVAETFDEFMAKYLLVTNERSRYSKEALEYFNQFHNPDDFKLNWVSLFEGI